MEEKEFNETRPCREELKKLAMTMEKYGIQEIKVTKSALSKIYHDPLSIACNFTFKDGTSFSRLLQERDFD